MTLSFRKASHADITPILEIERNAFTTPWHEETFRSLQEREEVDLIAAILEEKVVGYAVLWSTLDEGELANIAVAADYRGKGIGGELLRQVVEAAEKRGVRRVFLEVRASNTSAAKLYERYSFQQIGIRRGYYQNPVEDARVLVKELSMEKRTDRTQDQSREVGS